MKKVIYLFPTNRSELRKQVDQGVSPDNHLYGMNHLDDKYYVVEATCSPLLERWLNVLLLPISWWFNTRYTRINLSRVLLVMPQLNRADVVITCVDSVNRAAALVKKVGLLKPNLICMAGNVLDGSEKLQFIHRFVWQGANKIITHAPVDQEKLVTLGLTSRGVMIPPGSDGVFWMNNGKSRFRRRYINNNIFIVSVGADRDRDYKTLLAVAAKLPTVEFAVFTSSNLVNGFKVPSNVKLHFNATEIETRKALSRACLVVIPLVETNRASGQLALLDAILMKKGVIVSAARGVVDSYKLVDKTHAILAKPGSAKILLEAIELMSQNRSLSRSIAKAAHELALRYTTAEYAKKVDRLIETAPGSTI